MRSAAPLSFETRSALESIARGLRTARLRRRDSIRVAAERVGVSSSTWQRIEAGDEGIAWGLMLECLVKYGFEREVFALGDPARDAEGLLLDAKNLPRRGRRRAPSDPEPAPLPTGRPAGGG